MVFHCDLPIKINFKLNSRGVTASYLLPVCSPLFLFSSSAILLLLAPALHLLQAALLFLLAPPLLPLLLPPHLALTPLLLWAASRGRQRKTDRQREKRKEEFKLLPT